MRVLFAFIVVLLLTLAAYAGVEAGNLRFLFGVVIPYIAVFVFITGMIYGVLKWGSAPVPFRIPSTCGQQNSLPWIKQNKLENPSTMLGVIGRMTLAALFFRSLFRNLKTQLNEDSRLPYGEAKRRWLPGPGRHR